MNLLMRLSDKTLIVFAVILSAIASMGAVMSALDRSDEVRALATLDRPLPSVTSLDTTNMLSEVEGLGIFEEIIQYERDAAQLANGGPTVSEGPNDPSALPKPSAIVMQDDGITAFAFRDGMVMRFQEGDTVSGRTVVALSLSEIIFRDGDGNEETILLFGGNSADSERG